MFRISIGIMNGDMRPGPLVKRMLCWSEVVCRPPMPEPMNTPISSRFSLSKSSPESSSASRPATIANWVNRSVRRTSFDEGRKGAGSKSLISAAI